MTADAAHHGADVNHGVVERGQLRRGDVERTGDDLEVGDSRRVAVVSLDVVAGPVMDLLVALHAPDVTDERLPPDAPGGVLELEADLAPNPRGIGLHDVGQLVREELVTTAAVEPAGPGEDVRTDGEGLGTEGPAQRVGTTVRVQPDRPEVGAEAGLHAAAGAPG